ncbi:unnamed protein product [Phytomonas sp. EM1]|nr:unnamed protein product [Phytomonas sp. EM1]|eukprot:CCW65099.1 unnamed protein product [Phytomonas sp. isolate EM1]
MLEGVNHNLLYTYKHMYNHKYICKYSHDIYVYSFYNLCSTGSFIFIKYENKQNCVKSPKLDYQTPAHSNLFTDSMKQNQEHCFCSDSELS